MRLSWLYLGLALALPAGLSCSTSASTGDSNVPATPKDGTVLSFAIGDSITMTPGEARSLTVSANPPGNYQITLALVGETFDASLDEASVVASPAGSANVTLRAPSQATTFSVRATIDGGATAELAVSVSAKGFGTIKVIPAYAGKRDVTKWTASVAARTTCADLASVLPESPKGALSGSAPASSDPIVKNAPVGPSLAVSVRAGHFAWGCVDVANLQAGAVLEATVQVIDRPIALGSTDLDLDLEYVPEATEYAPLIAETLTLMSAAITPKGGTEGSALLEAMRAHTPSATAFDDARTKYQWDGTVDAKLGPTAFDAPVAKWVATALAAQSPHLQGRVTGGKNGDTGTLSVFSLGSVTAADAGITSDTLVALGVDVGDTMILTGTIHWLPSMLVGALAREGAIAAAPSASTVPEALALELDCTTLAAALQGDAACDATCFADACRAGLDDLWNQALGASASAGLFGAINVASTASATVDDVAAPTALDGVWLGAVTDTILSAKAKGKLAAKKPPVAPK